MMTPTILRVGALAAIFSVIGQVTSVVLSPDWSGPPDVGAASVVRAADIWMAWSLIKLVGILLTVPALTIMLRTLDGTEGGEWSRVCLPLAIVAVALGSVETLIGGSLVNVADAAAGASPAARAGYLAAFDATRNASDFVDFGAVMALGMAFLLLATAILVSRVYARAIGWSCAAAAGLVIVGLLGGLVGADTGLLVYAGTILIAIALVALAASMWRRAARLHDAPATIAPSGFDPATAAR
jgi:hypothetical protein